MLEIELLDFKGEYWRLQFAAIQYNKRDGMQYVFWHVLDGPAFLQENGAHYDVIFTPIYTEWFA